MIASWIVKRMIRKAILLMNEDDMDVDAVLAMSHDDIIWDCTSDLGIGETVYGKKDVTDWFLRWKEEFPKRKFDVKNICFSRWPLCLNNVITAQWSCTETDKQGKTLKYDGATVCHMKKFKVTHMSEYISFAGLPKLSDLIGPLA